MLSDLLQTIQKDQDALMADAIRKTKLLTDAGADEQQICAINHAAMFLLNGSAMQVAHLLHLAEKHDSMEAALAGLYYFQFTILCLQTVVSWGEKIGEPINSKFDPQHLKTCELNLQMCHNMVRDIQAKRDLEQSMREWDPARKPS